LVTVQESTRLTPNFDFKITKPSGKQVIKIEGLQKTFAGRTLFNDVHFQVNRGDKIAVIGANGMGKSTLLKILLQQLTADQGQLEWGAETYPAYFAQDHHDMLHEPISVLDWLTGQVSGATSSRIRNVLGQVLFSGDTVDKSIISLSGGESARLLFARIMLLPHNVLILDEPTNHLDLESIEALIESIKTYAGTVLVVSHDRYFIEKVANRVIALTPDGVQDFYGDYAAYLMFCDEGKAASVSVAHQSTEKEVATPQDNSFEARKQRKQARNKLQKEAQRLQQQIEQLEKEQEEVLQQLADPTLYDAAGKGRQEGLLQKKQAIKNELEKIYQRWEGALLELESN